MGEHCGMTDLVFERPIPALLSAVALMLCLWLPARAETPEPASKPPQPNDRRFLDDRERGWFWRELDPTLQEPPQEPTPPPGPSAPPAEKAPPQPLTVEWLKVELEKAQIAAINNPTQENVEWNSFLLRLSMDKAKKYTEASIEVNASNPFLDGTASREQTSYGRLLERQSMYEKRRDLVKGVAGDMGLWYFYAESCDYCARFNSALNTFAEAYEMPVLAISMDGGPPRDGFWPDYVRDSGQAAHLQIKQTPTVYLYRPPDQLILFSVGLQTMELLEKRLLRIAEKEGWITPDQKRFAVRGLREKYLLDAVEEINSSIDWSNREEALEALREASVFGVEKQGVTELPPMIGLGE